MNLINHIKFQGVWVTLNPKASAWWTKIKVSVKLLEFFNYNQRFAGAKNNKFTLKFERINSDGLEILLKF